MWKSAFLFCLSALLVACGDSAQQPARDSGDTGAVTEMADRATEMIDTAKAAAERAGSGSLGSVVDQVLATLGW